MEDKGKTVWIVEYTECAVFNNREDAYKFDRDRPFFGYVKDGVEIGNVNSTIREVEYVDIITENGLMPQVCNVKELK